MAINVCNIEECNNNYQYIVMYILQIMTICNAIKEGWKVKKIDNKTYEFKKNNFNYDEFNLEEFINKITSF
jgi:hypothetical protein